jgi:hypothetical protein
MHDIGLGFKFPTGVKPIFAPGINLRGKFPLANVIKTTEPLALLGTLALVQLIDVQAANNETY